MVIIIILYRTDEINDSSLCIETEFSLTQINTQFNFL